MFPFFGLNVQGGDRCYEEILIDFAPKSMILYRFSDSRPLDGDV